MERSAAWRRGLRVVGALVVLVVFAACGESHPPAATDAPSESGAPRIAALSPAIAIILRDLGLSDRIVARHAFDQVTPGEVPSAGDQGGIDYETLLRAEPTHVFLQWGARDLPPRLVEFARERHWVVESLPLLTIDEIESSTTRLAELVGNAAARENAARWSARLDEALRPRPDLAERAGRCLALYWTDPPGAAGPGSFHQQILERLGVAPAITEGGAYVTLDPEDIKRLDPDSILLLMEGADPARLTELLGPLARLDLRCVAEGRVAVVSDPLVNMPATSIVGVVEEIETDILAMPPAGPDR